jgi:hypothetical protein
MINKITFCLRDKPESFSFDFDYYRILDDGSITYGGVTKHTGLSSNEFNNIESIFLNIDRFDLIVHRTYDLASIGASSTSIINNKIIYPEIINFDNTKADGQHIFKKIKSLTIKPIIIWNLENDDVDFYKHLPAIRREIKLSRLGI